jgi:Leucine-rich repeat (LRR) protein
LTCDFIAERDYNIKFQDLKILDYPQSGIRMVDLSINVEQFDNLSSLNLENNLLTSFSGIVYLKNLKALCLNSNKIESIYPKSKSCVQANLGNPVNVLDEIILPKLEVLHLAYNGIADLVALQIAKLTSLRVLFLQGFRIISQVIFFFELTFIYFCFCFI